MIQTAEGTSLRRKERWRKEVQEMEVRQTGEVGEREQRHLWREAQRSSGKGRPGRKQCKLSADRTEEGD